MAPYRRKEPDSGPGRRWPPLLRLHAGKRGRRLPRWRWVLGVSAAAVAGVLLLWTLAGMLPGLPSVVEVLGMKGLRVIAGVIVACLLLASVAFAEF